MPKPRYDRQHRRRRAKWAKEVARGGVVCSRCRQPIAPLEPWDLGHDDDDPSRPPFPEHARCNRATLTHAKQNAVSGGVQRWSRHWFGGFDARCPDCLELDAPCEVARTFEAPAAAQVANAERTLKDA
jgi:hypothetical protein